MENAPLSPLEQRIIAHLHVIYPNLDHKELAQKCLTTFQLDPATESPRPHRNLWDQSDIMLITYADTLRRKEEAPLETLHQFVKSTLSDCISAVHLLPFFPYSSDDGFSVMDYTTVNPSCGRWANIVNLSKDFKVMGDLVINHCSSRSLWFENYKAGVDPGSRFFYEADPNTDLSAVVRPRTSPLLREVQTKNGTKHVWCTFSHDQIDLNFSNPEVFLEVMRLISMYIDKGASIFRLDAIGFLWKIIGTSCIHLPETHQAIQLMRALIEYRLSDAIIITETNVPKRENLTYFGNGNEAHMVYNFSLPPLLVNALLTGSAKHLKTWLMSMPPAQLGTTFLNFIASHDGIGVRPAEGILDPEELQNMIHALQSFGAQVSWRTGLNGEKHPYEINIALFDAFKGTCEGEDDYQVERMLCAHAIAIALEGVPAIYIHSFFATENDYESLEKTEHNRDINRHQWQEDALTPLLEDVNSKHYAVLSGLNRLIALRKKHAAFHPNATQFTLHLDDALFGFWRQSLTRHQSVFVINNVTNQSQTFSLAQLNLIDMDEWKEIITDQMITDLYGEMVLAPYQAVWITNRW